MIFVTVGTHEQQFNRLVQKIDMLKKQGKIQEEVIMQIGFSTYEPKYCKWQKLYSYAEMQEFVKQARIVVTHGGPSSFITVLKEGKIPIVVPRNRQFEEHINNHQVEFCKVVEDRMGNIILVEDMEKLENIIADYENIVFSMNGEIESHNARFNIEFEKMIEEMFHVY